MEYNKVIPVDTSEVPPDSPFFGVTGLVRVYDFQPYTQWAIKRYLREDFNLELEWVRSYKEGRYPGYRRKFRLKDIDTGKMSKERFTLDDLRCFFARRGYPLDPDERVKRNPHCEMFLEAVREVVRSTESLVDGGDGNA